MILFPQRIDKDIAANDPVRLVGSIVDQLDLSGFRKLYNDRGRCPYHPKMLLKVVIYAYMNNIYSCRRIEQALKRDVHFIWLAHMLSKSLLDSYHIHSNNSDILKFTAHVQVS